MRRPLTAALALLTVVGIAGAQAQAAPPKKPKPIKGSYTLTLVPDPVGETGAVTGSACGVVNPLSTDTHPFTVPARGLLQVVLDSPDPTETGTTDWDMALLGADGSPLSTGTSPASHEEVSAKFKKKETVSFLVCNLIGQPSATVSYTFTYT